MVLWSKWFGDCSGLYPFSTFNIPRITVDKLIDPDYQSFLSGEKPFVLIGAMQNWTAMYTWDNVDYLAAAFPDQVVKFYPHNLQYPERFPFYRTLNNAWHDMKKQKEPTYIHWPLKLAVWKRLFKDVSPLPLLLRRNRMWIKTCLSEPAIKENFWSAANWYSLLIGKQKASMFFHSDSTLYSSWQAQISGRKKWALCAPGQEENLYNAGDINVWKPDLEQYPLFKICKLYPIHCICW